MLCPLQRPREGGLTSVQPADGSLRAQRRKAGLGHRTTVGLCWRVKPGRIWWWPQVSFAHPSSIHHLASGASHGCEEWLPGWEEVSPFIVLMAFRVPS